MLATCLAWEGCSVPHFCSEGLISRQKQLIFEHCCEALDKWLIYFDTWTNVQPGYFQELESEGHYHFAEH